jgi:hypothetical protein
MKWCNVIGFSDWGYSLMRHCFFKKRSTISIVDIKDSGPVIDETATILNVQRAHTSTYVDSNTTHSNEELIGINIYTNDYESIKIYYNNKLMDITPTFGAIQFLIGKYLGVDDGTDPSGTLIITGKYYGLCVRGHSSGKSTTTYLPCITDIIQLGTVLTQFPSYAFSNIVNVPSEFEVPDHINSIDKGVWSG